MPALKRLRLATERVLTLLHEEDWDLRADGGRNQDIMSGLIIAINRQIERNMTTNDLARLNVNPFPMKASLYNKCSSTLLNFQEVEPVLWRLHTACIALEIANDISPKSVRNIKKKFIDQMWELWSGQLVVQSSLSLSYPTNRSELKKMPSDFVSFIMEINQKLGKPYRLSGSTERKAIVALLRTRGANSIRRVKRKIHRQSP